MTTPRHFEAEDSPKDFAPWQVTVRLKDGSELVIYCGRNDLEKIHAQARQVLARLAREEAGRDA